MFCARLFICALWSPAWKGLTSWLSFVVSSVSLSLSHWYPGSGVVLDCIDSWSLHHYLLLKKSVNTSCWRHYQENLKLFCGVTYATWCYTLTLPLSESLHISFCGLYNVVFGNHSVHNSPWREGGTIANEMPRELHFTFLCDMGLPCSTSNNSKSI